MRLVPTLHLRRDVFGRASTLGALYWQGRPFGWACEDEDRGLAQDMAPAEIAALKVRAETAIPVGLYHVQTTWSPRYRRLMPLVLGVPGFQGIRIHGGNRATDTAGCILPGLSRDSTAMTVSRSRAACAWLYAEIAALEALGEPVTLLIDRDDGAWRARGAR